MFARVIETNNKAITVIINHKYKFIFVHIPKAAGTSVTQVLSALSTYRDQEIGGTAFGEQVQEAYKLRFGLRKHATVKQIEEAIEADDFASYFKFAFVRHPLARLISAYNFANKWAGTPQESRERLDPFGSVEEFLSSDLWTRWAGPDRIFASQLEWLGDWPNGSSAVNFVGKVENIANDLQFIADKVGFNLDQSALGHHNRSKYDAPASVPESVASSVHTFFKQEYDTLGYSTWP